MPANLSHDVVWVHVAQFYDVAMPAEICGGAAAGAGFFQFVWQNHESFLRDSSWLEIALVIKQVQF